MTINPLPHIDPIGTILLPLAGMIFQLPLLGWAKPVPVNLNNVRGDKRTANMLIAAAGPISNLILCAFFIVVHAVCIKYQLLQPDTFFYPLLKLFGILVMVNAILAFFNLIPMPPLDGGAILSGFLPEEMAFKFEQFLSQFGFMILMILVIFGGLSWISALSSAYIDMISHYLSFLL